MNERFTIIHHRRCGVVISIITIILSSSVRMHLRESLSVLAGLGIMAMFDVFASVYITLELAGHFLWLHKVSWFGRQLAQICAITRVIIPLKQYSFVHEM